MNSSHVMLKIALLFCCSLILPCHWCEAVSAESEYFSIDDKTVLSILSEMEQCSTSSYEVGIEALAFKTDAVNATNFEVTGVTGLKNEQFGIKPIVGTQLSYGGKDFNDMDELLDFLKNDSTIEILGFSRDLCENHKTVKMFDHSDTKVTNHMLENLKMNPEEEVCLENTLCLEPEIVGDSRINLTIFLEKVALKLDPCSNGEFVLLPRERYILTNVPVPNRFFALLPGLILEGNNEPTFGRTSVQSKDTSVQTQRSVVLILRPFIFKE